MKIKTIIKIALLLFVLASVAHLIVEQVQSNRKLPPARMSLQKTAESDVPVTQKKNLSIVVYYFYGTVRCATCRNLESFTNEALRMEFSEELGDGRLQWQPINIDEPNNKHFVNDYQLFTKSVIVAKIQDGKQTEWKNLNRIWELVRDKQTFIKYIQDEIRDYLGAN
ncbi:MAG: hypothetical protein KAS75_06205 [Planctomycetes bacterium]|nr:hypothetical protein [Planctomycetota bacterium]